MIFYGLLLYIGIKMCLPTLYMIIAGAGFAVHAALFLWNVYKRGRNSGG